MEPLKTHGTVLPQQALTRPAGGCPSGPRPEDLMQGGHEGANLHAGQRVAMITDDLSLNTDPNTLTKLEIYNVLVEKARQYGPKQRPRDLEINERTMIILNALYPTGIPNNIDIQNKSLSENISKFISKCENLFNDSKNNFKRFSKKNEKWLATIFDVKIPTKIEKNPIELNKNVDSSQEAEPSSKGSVSDMLLTEPIPETSYETPSTSNIFSNRQEESIPGTSNDTPSTSNIFSNRQEESIPGTSNVTPSASNEKSSRQMRRIRKNFEDSLQDQPQSKIIKMM